jgi:hypothetical protein
MVGKRKGFIVFLRHYEQRVPDAVQRSSRCTAEPGPKAGTQGRVQDGPRISSAPRRKERRDAQHPGHAFLVHALIPDTRSPSRREAPEALFSSAAQRGRGERRMPVAPAASCALVVVERTRVTTSTPESPGIPARNGFNGFFRALPGDRAVLPPSSADMVLSKPGRADSTSANLTPASGRQDHTTSPYAATSLVRTLSDRSQAFRQPALQPFRAQNAAASTASLPASVTIMIRPSGGVGCEKF